MPAVHFQFCLHLQLAALHPPGSEQGQSLPQGYALTAHLQSGPQEKLGSK